MGGQHFECGASGRPGDLAHDSESTFLEMALVSSYTSITNVLIFTEIMLKNNVHCTYLSSENKIIVNACFEFMLYQKLKKKKVLVKLININNNILYQFLLQLQLFTNYRYFNSDNKIYGEHLYTFITKHKYYLQRDI